MTQLRCMGVLKTHSGMLPQSRTLEAPAADNLRGVGETGRGMGRPSSIAEGSGAGKSAGTRHKARKGTPYGAEKGGLIAWSSSWTSISGR